jgi:hypothetical protein
MSSDLALVFIVFVIAAVIVAVVFSALGLSGTALDLGGPMIAICVATGALWLRRRAAGR